MFLTMLDHKDTKTFRNSEFGFRIWEAARRKWVPKVRIPKSEFRNPKRTALAIAACSCAVLLTEITLTRIFSVTLMYHYAFLVLSVTLFGLGSGGIFHFVSDRFRKDPSSPAWLALSAAAMLPLCLGAILRLPFSPQVFSFSNMGVLFAIIVLAAIPFFFAGAFISLLYMLNRGSISNLYAFDLMGAALGCALA